MVPSLSQRQALCFVTAWCLAIEMLSTFPEFQDDRLQVLDLLLKYGLLCANGLEIHTWLPADNAKAITFFERNGFVSI